RMRFIYLLKSKSESFDKFIEFQRMAENQTGNRIKAVISDNGAPYTPQQNPISERANRTLFEKVRVMLHDYQVPSEWWGEACAMATFILNRTPSSAISFQTPASIWASLETNLSNLHPFGCSVVMHVPKEKRVSKVNPTGVLCMLVGLTEAHHNFRLFNPLTKKIHISHDCTFLDGEAFWPSFISSSSTVSTPTSPSCLHFPSNANAPPNCASDSLVAAPALENSESVAISGASEITPVVVRACEDVTAPAVSTDNLQPRRLFSSDQETGLEDHELPVTPNNENNNLPKGWTYDVVPVVPPLNISSKISEDNVVSGKRVRKPPACFADVVINSAPRSYSDALRLDSAEKWVVAIQNEFASLERHGVLEEVPYDGSFRLLDTVWVFREKTDSSGNPVEAKARLCVKGFLQVENLDFHETFAPTGRLSTLCFLLGYCAANDLDLHQMDVKTAFLHGDLDEDLHIRVPEGYTSSLKGSVCLKLKKSLYGLKQSPRNWYLRIKKFFEDSGFRPSAADPCLFMRDGEDPCFVFLHVDDLVIGGRNLQKFKSEISRAFDMKDLGELRYVLGMLVKRNREKRGLFLSQELYINNLLATFGMQECKSVSTPQVPGSRLLPRADTNAPAALINYRRAIGLLNYLVTCTRPDLAYSASCLAQFLNDPSSEHEAAFKHVLRYLSGTRTWGISLGLAVVCSSMALLDGKHPSRMLFLSPRLKRNTVIMRQSGRDCAPQEPIVSASDSTHQASPSLVP
ncbi:hypothetical protein O181_075583, partial [Austropuccinia psidii MF-1]|nr:hypothetical protein [Austropuccinia psidii MF-1]